MPLLAPLLPLLLERESETSASLPLRSLSVISKSLKKRGAQRCLLMMQATCGARGADDADAQGSERRQNPCSRLPSASVRQNANSCNVSISFLVLVASGMCDLEKKSS